MESAEEALKQTDAREFGGSGDEALTPTIRCGLLIYLL